MHWPTSIAALAACLTLGAQQPVFVEKELRGPTGPKGEVGPHIGMPAPPLEAR